MTKVEWDYSAQAAHYDKRAEYSSQAIDSMLEAAELEAPAQVADLGAGTGKLSRPLAQRGLRVLAVEPNEEMRRFGIRNTTGLPVTWNSGTGEQTGLRGASVDAVFFGSSFNVVNQPAALAECNRILRPRGWFCCMWNHRELDDPLQAGIEAIIKRSIPNYDYGKRREDPSAAIAGSALFELPKYVEGGFIVQMSHDDIIEAWRSHATLARQAGNRFDVIVDEIAAIVPNKPAVAVPYTTRIWFARLKRG
jgi:ubiquinone/menaquinone biosynthesis C-methylase UbiE